MGPTTGSSPFCSHCVRRFCDKIRHRSPACWKHQWKLATTEYKFVKGFGPSLIKMGPPDLIEFLVNGAESQILSCPAAAVLAAQMWCPVAVRHFCKAIRSRPQEAKTGKGLMNIFLDTVRHATLVDKDDRHRDHQELKAIWSSIVGFERRLCLCMTDTLRRWAVWWEGQAQGQRTRQPPATDSRKNLQTLACWAARQTRACKFLREGQGGVLPNPSIASPTQLSDQESWKYAVDSGSQTHVGIAPLGQRLGVLHNRDDVGSLVAGKERGGASSPDARQKRARADDGLV